MGRKSLVVVMVCAAFFSIALTGLVLDACAQDEAATASKTTLDNLMTAYNGERNANARYLAFAQKADEEGYGQVASLFRAAARAEQVHFERHAAIITELGGTPAAKIEMPVVKTTRENVEEALKGETYEANMMYPEFLAKAEADKITNAVDAFEDAKAAEAVHAGWYKKVLDSMDSWKGTKMDFYVCPKCGNVVDAIPGLSCPLCMEDTKKFMKVS